MARAKRVSDEIYNERRRLRRAMNRLLKSNPNANVSQLQSLIAKTYADKKGRYAQDIEQVRSDVRQNYMIQKARENKVTNDRFFKSVLSSALKGEDVYSIKQIDVKLFMRATQNLWQNVPYEKRYEAIKEGLGFSTLYEAFKYVMSLSDVQAFLKGGLKGYFAAKGYISDTDDDDNFAFDDDFSDYKYPTFSFLNLFTPIGFVK